MPTIATEGLYRDISPEPTRKKWTRSECAAFQATGLWDQQRLELVEGELINKMGKNRPHSIALILMRSWLTQAFGDLYVETETAIDVAPADNPTNEPQPDVIVLARPALEYRECNPHPADIRLVVEISDSTLGFDLKIKAALYARAGILDYWVLDIPARRLIVHRDPRDGRYQSVVVYSEQESVSPLALPDRAFPIAEAFREE